MNTLDFLSRLRKLGINLSVEDQKLRLNAPQGVLTPSLKAELKNRKIELLNFLRKQQQAGFAAPPPIRPIDRSSNMPLSFAQQRLWFLTQMEPEQPVYNVPMAFRLSGLLNIEALSQSVADMIARHEILRTTFSTNDGQPVQIIHESVEKPLSIGDFQHLPEDKREIEVQNAVEQEITKPFDLENGPLFRTKLLRLAPSEQILLILTHHIVFDGWSYEILCHELSALYAANVAGQPLQLPKLPIQYAHFAAWQREWLKGPSLETQVDYWRKQLADAPKVLQLPTDHPYPAVQRLQGRNYNFALPPELSLALHTFSQQEGTTLFMTGLASFMVLLYRYTRQEDLIIGTPIANRGHVELEGLIGPLINTLALRTIISEGLSFRELLSQVRRTALAAYDHQDLPFEKLVELLHLERDISHTPLFQVMFVLQQKTSNQLSLTGLEVSEIELDTHTAKFDLTLNLIEGKTGIRGQLEYSTDLFDDATIERLVRHYETLLENIVANPEQRISDLQILTDRERKQMLVDWNDTSSGYPCDRCVHQLFETQAEQTPSSVAVVFGDHQLTYQELNSRANQLAHYLLRQGIGPDVLVGICVQRSLETVVGLLGILKAGGAYVPLDPAYPAERLAFMLSDTQTPVLLTQKRLGDKLPAYAGKILCLDGDESTIARENEENPISGATPANLAYVIYTSGSTGQPKGVKIQHAGVVNLMAWHQQTYKVTPADRVTQLASLAFDASVWELWPHLTAGASIHIPNEETRSSPPKLLEWLSAEAITLSFMPTPLAESVLEEQLPRSLVLRALLTGGDKLHRRPSKNLPFRLVNHYGPTENTVVTTWAPVDPSTEVDAPPPIGRPICNTQVYILDHHLNPVPIGIPGELYISGDGLARGYLNRPDLTVEKFLSNPFSEDSTARIYKTGDMARYLPNGNIEFLGRIDHQVKIRGFRIELGEVESVLAEHPAIGEAVVIAREDVPGDKRLVAYVVVNHETTPTFSELRSFLKEKLPDYMIPTALVFLDHLPLTANGKVDRRALPAPDRKRSQPAEVFVAPRDELELQLTKIWEKVLGVKNIGMKDNFFDLGGHSLLAVQLFARIQKIFGKDLPLTTLFQAPTIGQLTRIIRREGWSSPWSSLAPIQHGGSKPPFFCVHGCTGKVLHFHDLARLLGPEQPFYGLSALGLEKGQVPQNRFEDMAAHYIQEIRTIQFNGPYFIGGCAIALEMANQLESQGQKVRLLVLMTPGPFNSNKSYHILSHYYDSLKKFFGLLIGLMKKRPLLPNIWHAFLNRVLWHWKIFHRFLPSDIHRWRRFINDFYKAQKNYHPKTYHGRITYFLREEVSHDHKKAFSEWYDLAAGGLDIQFVPGTIVSMWREPHVRKLAEQLKACLEAAQTDSDEFMDTKN